MIPNNPTPEPKINNENEMALPGMLVGKNATNNMDNYAVRYLKVDVDDGAARIELEKIETRAYRNQGVFVLSKEKFTFMDKFYFVVSYLEEVEKAEKSNEDRIREILGDPKKPA